MTSQPARADSRRNRAAILQAAGPLVLEHPETTMAEVAAAAGVTRATLYRHFPDRAALLDALLLDAAEQVLPRVLAAVDEPSAEIAVTRLTEAVVEAGHAHRALLRALPVPLAELARSVVPDEPLALSLRRWRADGQLDTDSGEQWLALAARALCLVAVADERPSAEVALDLASSLRRLFGVR